MAAQQAGGLPRRLQPCLQRGAAPQQGSPPAGRLGPCRRRSAPPAPRQGRLLHRQQQTALAVAQPGRLLRHQQRTAFPAQQQGRHALSCQQSAPAAPQQGTTSRRQPQRTPLQQGRPRRRPQPRPRPARRRPGALSAGGPRTRPPPRAAPVRLTRWRLRRLPRPRSATRGSRFPPRSLPYPTCMLTAEPGHAGAQRRSRGRVPCVGHAVCCDVGCGGSARLRELELEHLARTVQSAWCDAERAVGGGPVLLCEQTLRRHCTSAQHPFRQNMCLCNIRNLAVGRYVQSPLCPAHLCRSMRCIQSSAWRKSLRRCPTRCCTTPH